MGGAGNTRLGADPVQPREVLDDPGGCCITPGVGVGELGPLHGTGHVQGALSSVVVTLTVSTVLEKEPYVLSVHWAPQTTRWVLDEKL